MKKLHLGLILFCSLLLNIGFLLNIVYISYSESKKVEIKETKEDFINKLYDLNNYNSFSYDEQTFKKRIDKIYSQFLKEKEYAHTEFYEDDETVKVYWKKRGEINVRKINVMMTKLDTIEKVITNSLGNDENAKKYFDMLIEQKGYHEKLRIMSNFYAKFLPEEICELIHNTTD